MIPLLLSQWKPLALAGLCAALASLFALWRIEARHAQHLALQVEAARAAEVMDQAQAAASRSAAGVASRGAGRDARTLDLHTENSHAIESARGFGQSLDPELNAAGRRGLCGFAAYASDPACVQLRGPDPRRGPHADVADAPAAP